MPVNPASKTFLSAKNYITKDFKFLFVDSLKWLGLSIILGCLVGAASAAFLNLLHLATNYREANLWIIYFLPLAGLLIGFSYHYYGKEAVKGNNLLIEELQSPKKIIPLIMAPLVFIGTIVTHLFGGSAGREGTSVQVGGAIADQFTKVLKLKPRDRKIILICGISAGFASVFGTPLAGAVFGLEVFVIGSLLYTAILPSFISAVVAHYVCLQLGAHHTHYEVPNVPPIDLLKAGYCLATGILFGLAARSFSVLNQKLSGIFKKIKYPPIRPVVGGIIFLAIIIGFGAYRFLGLGLPEISAAFTKQEKYYTFAVKIALTALTLSAGFKGGEVTPLFFIGATLGSFLSVFVPLPVGLLAAMGFVAVFSGAANTPLACIFMGIELFGAATGVYIALACVMAYIFSGHSGIYESQSIGSPKHLLLKRHQFLR